MNKFNNNKASFFEDYFISLKATINNIDENQFLLITNFLKKKN